MRKYFLTLLISLLPHCVAAQFVQDYKFLDGNNISAHFINTGIFDQNITVNNSPGFEWPKGSGKFAILSSGLSIAAKINGELRMAAASYTGEYRPGYIAGGSPMTNSNFKMYKVKRGDNQFNNPDYANWGMMVPYGAPYVDVNNNGLYEPAIDTPGVKNASQTIFICLTDGFPESHTSTEGFGGGTAPLMAEVHFTSWCYDTPGLEDVQFMRWDIVNKSGATWNGAIFTLLSETDLGDKTDDRIGCDTSINLGYTYNGDNMDSSKSGTSYYGMNPPAVGMSLLKTPLKQNGEQFGLSSFVYYRNGVGGSTCQHAPQTLPDTYNYMKGLKRDGTPWLNPNTLMRTSYNFSGDPETGAGWTEEDGFIHNCSGDTTGFIEPHPPGDRRMIMNTGDTLHNVNNGQMVTIVASQKIARGSNNLNSVTKLKQLTNTIHNYWQTIGINPISSEIPNKYTLEQNYPNPFNPSTKIRFSIPKNSSLVKLTVFDVTGKEVVRLVNEGLQAGVYEYDFSATGGGLASGMYFYKLEAGDFVETRKMVLVK